jgi:hypothetical protein
MPISGFSYEAKNCILTVLISVNDGSMYFVVCGGVCVCGGGCVCVCILIKVWWDKTLRAKKAMLSLLTMAYVNYRTIYVISTVIPFGFNFVITVTCTSVTVGKGGV